MVDCRESGSPPSWLSARDTCWACSLAGVSLLGTDIRSEKWYSEIVGWSLTSLRPGWRTRLVSPSTLAGCFLAAAAQSAPSPQNATLLAASRKVEVAKTGTCGRDFSIDATKQLFLCIFSRAQMESPGCWPGLGYRLRGLRKSKTGECGYHSPTRHFICGNGIDGRACDALVAEGLLDDRRIDVCAHQSEA